MTILRVLIAAPPDPDRAARWALYDSDGRLARTGLDRPAAWPSADSTEAVIAATQARVATLSLPPLPPVQVAAAAAFALEDQLAGPLDGQHLAASRQQSDGRVRVAIVARPLMAALAAARSARPFSRIVVESDLASTIPGWRWCAEDDRAFVRSAEGEAFAVDPPAHDAALPAELAFALDRATRDGAPPSGVRVDASVADADLTRWQHESGIAFTRGAPWRWHEAAPAAFAAATDLRQGEFAVVAPAQKSERLRLFRWAAGLAACALALQVAATAGEWVWFKVDAIRQARTWTALATGAGVPGDQADSVAAARAALFRRHAELRHAAGLAAPGDALPLLARAAPALAALPGGAVRRATYADGHWTLELAVANDAALRDFDVRMHAAGVPVLMATTAAGTRARFGGP